MVYVLFADVAHSGEDESTSHHSHVAAVSPSVTTPTTMATSDKHKIAALVAYDTDSDTDTDS